MFIPEDIYRETYSKLTGCPTEEKEQIMSIKNWKELTNRDS